MRSRGRNSGHSPALPAEPPEKWTADVILPPVSHRPFVGQRPALLVVGASTGGTEALPAVLAKLPTDAPPVMVVQHMPAKFTGPFARRLDSMCPCTVREAVHDEMVGRGQIRIAAGDRHLVAVRYGSMFKTELRTGPPVCRHRPSVDVLFRSAASASGRAAVAVLLTGMGDDGARGMVELRSVGGHTVVQNQATCVVFGMPNEAIKRMAVDAVLPLERIAEHVMKRFRTEVQNHE